MAKIDKKQLKQNVQDSLTKADNALPTTGGTMSGSIICSYSGRKVQIRNASFNCISPSTTPGVYWAGSVNMMANDETTFLYGLNFFGNADVPLSIGLGKAYNNTDLVIDYATGNVGIGQGSNYKMSEKLQVNGNVLANGFKTPSGTSTQLLTANGGVREVNGLTSRAESTSLSTITTLAEGQYLIITNNITSNNSLTLNFPTAVKDFYLETVVTFTTTVAVGIKINTYSTGKIYTPKGVLPNGGTFTTTAGKSYVISSLAGDVIVGEF